MSWEPRDKGGKFSTSEEAEAWGNAWLDRIEHKLDGHIVGAEPDTGEST